MVQVGDANFNLDFTDSAEPTIGFDSGGDEFLYVRASNEFRWRVGTNSQLALSSGLLHCVVNDRTALGSATVAFSDLFLAAGGLVNINNGNTTLGEGQIKFPATQIASSNANTLDDYEEGTWTPVVTFATPGDLSVAYSAQIGHYTKIGRLVYVEFNVVTSTFTHTTASGNLTVTGLPFTSSGTNRCCGLNWSGITKAGYTSVVSLLGTGATSFIFSASGSGVAASNVAVADVPTGGTVILRGTLIYDDA
mgnify:CR=1 FL=1